MCQGCLRNDGVWLERREGTVTDGGVVVGEVTKDQNRQGVWAVRTLAFLWAGRDCWGIGSWGET